MPHSNSDIEEECADTAASYCSGSIATGVDSDQY